ncbi:MAG TPA: carbohydrate-binding family 9-like protein [Fimbriimonadaceae bacterium]|nr:carbohydrate-binding family 9-like protein [Fimbriimonadaceae bacterium]
MTPRHYVCPRADEHWETDGRLDKPIWERAPWSDAFVDIHEGPIPRHETRVKMLWNYEGLHIGAWLEEPHLWATLTDHDSVIFQDNDFEVFLDPDGDHHLYYEIEVNALGTEWDLLLVKPYRDGGPAMNAWEIEGLRVGVHLDGTLNDPSDQDRGWSVEIALPWAVLGQAAGVRCPPEPGDQWRINFSRVQWTLDVIDGRYVKRPGLPEDNWVWTPQGAIDMHRPERWGFLQFAEDADAPFVLDPDWEIREALIAVYHAERAHLAAHGSWSDSLVELGLSLPDIELHTSPVGFVALAPCASGGRLAIREDSRLWREGRA